MPYFYVAKNKFRETLTDYSLVYVDRSQVNLLDHQGSIGFGVIVAVISLVMHNKFSIHKVK